MRNKFMKPLLGIGLWAATACTGPQVSTKSPLGEPFPPVEGTSLAGKTVVIPGDFAGSPLLLLVGFEQDAQFDIDRWMLGLLQARADLQVLEIPTIDGLIPWILSPYIDSGMRSGIPEDDWGAVVTIYKDSDKIVEAFGDGKARNALVVLLDSQGVVRNIYRDGYSPRLLVELLKAANDLKESTK